MKNASEGTTPHNASSTGVATTGGTPTPERLTPGDPARRDWLRNALPSQRRRTVAWAGLPT
ncbi:MAG: hypothetical protein JOZ78_01025 [Chroococcidiopsidaceae cyanobacterium CP_BM_ER_R8_30]|nr:hypothetical protein [Chroococcidiopsidaceae cyanobacterium CP_BM_ER_R8_30]